MADPLIGHALGGRYRVMERIAAGGMGQIYRSAHTRIASLFAIKVMYGDTAYDESMRSRFAREAEVVSCLQSRHIVRVVDFGEDPLLYLAMEYLEGVTLDEAITRDGAFAPHRAVSVARQIARGLAHAHERGVIHRDLKSANVMLVEEDDETDIVKLLDFGIAQMRGTERLTVVGTVMGTPHYMAPEQFSNAELDARADLYALGIIFYEMLKGEVPFETDSVHELARMHHTVAPTPLSSLPGSLVPDRLDHIVMRLLAKRPSDRFPSARALIDALKQLEGPVSGWTALPEVAPPPAEPSVTEVIRAAIHSGAPAYNAGDHVGCFEGYANAAERLLARTSPKLAIATSARLEVALLRARRTDPTRAAWEMRYAFDDILHTSADVLLHQGADAMGTELAIVREMSASRYAAGELDLVGDYQIHFASRLARQLRADNVNQTMCAALESMVEMGQRAGGGQRALGIVGGVLETLHREVSRPSMPSPSHPSNVGAAQNTSAPGSLTPGSFSPGSFAPGSFAPGSLGSLTPSGANPSSLTPASIIPSSADLRACASLSRVAAAVTHAIGIGAPAYNRGDVDACFRLYRQTAIAMTEALASDPTGAACRTMLDQAIRAADQMGPSDAAWRLRRTFDVILSA